MLCTIFCVRDCKTTLLLFYLATTFIPIDNDLGSLTISSFIAYHASSLVDVVVAPSVVLTDHRRLIIRDDKAVASKYIADYIISMLNAFIGLNQAECLDRSDQVVLPKSTKALCSRSADWFFS